MSTTTRATPATTLRPTPPAPEPRSGARAVRAAGRVLRVGLAWTALAGILAGVPLLLTQLAVVLPIDLASLEPGALVRPDDGSLLLVLLLAVAWLAWAGIVTSLLVEVWAAIRQIPTPRVSGLAGPQRIAGALVASLALSGPIGPAAAAPPTGPPLALVAQLSGAAASVPVEADAPEPAEQAADGAQPELPRVTTKRHDTLWLLAEQHLGSGERYVEILALNAGTHQPDGRALGSDGRVYPGWTLRLPADADLGSARPDRHRVQRGDTLWGIADEELGDPTRYPEIVALNAGDLQPDGRRLADPDLILPGWVLEVPDAGQPGSDPAAPDPIPAPESAPDPVPESAPDPEAQPEAEPEAESAPEPDAAEGAQGLPPLDRGVPAPLATPDGPASGGLRPGGAPDASPRAGADLDGSAPSLDRAAVGPSAPAEAAILMPAGGAVAALLLAGLASQVATRRHRFQRHRRPGEQLAPLADPARAVEALARAALTEPTPLLLDQVLRQLMAQASAAGRRVPRVRLIHLGADAIRVDLAQDAPDGIAPFRATDARTWHFDPGQFEQSGPSPEQRAEPRPFPGLITVGCTGTDTVLLNLTEVGTLRVAGDPAAVPGVLRALAAEVSLGAEHAGSAPVALLAESAAAAIPAAMPAGSVDLADDPRRVAAALVAGVRRGEPLPDGDPLEIVVADRPLEVAVPARCGAALITTDPGAPAGAVLTVTADGTARLDPGGIVLTPQSLSAGSCAGVAGLLASADLPDERAPSHEPRLPAEPETTVDSDAVGVGSPAAASQASAASPGDPPRRAGHPGAAPGGSDTAAAAEVPPPRLLLLGELAVANARGRAESTRIGRLAETAAFVLLNPDARPSALQAALWPGRRSNPQTCRQMISRTRTWLGRDPQGQPYLMNLADAEQRLRLRPEIGSDWADFQRLADAGLRDPDDTEHLAQALRLIRGRPFGPTTARELPWADLHVNDMISLITDVAHALALRHERAGQWAQARDAALRGLRTESESEALTSILARIERRG